MVNLFENFVVNSENQVIETKIDKFNKNEVVIGDINYKIEELLKIKNDVISLKINNKNYTIKFSKNNNEILLNTNGFTYKYNVKTKSQVKFEKITQKSGVKKAKNPIVKSPMPGLIIKIMVNVGDNVKKGDKLIVIEAMKMENAISCQFDGIVKSITAIEGTAVEKDAVLVTLE